MTCCTAIKVEFRNVGAEFSLVLLRSGSLFRTVSPKISDGSRVDHHHIDRGCDRIDALRNVCDVVLHGTLDGVVPSTPAHEPHGADVPTGLDAIPSDYATPIDPVPRPHYGTGLDPSLRVSVAGDIDLDRCQ